jgi:hypothetical protein
VEMPGPWKAWNKNKAVSILPPAPWKAPIELAPFHIPTATTTVLIYVDASQRQELQDKAGSRTTASRCHSRSDNRKQKQKDKRLSI